MRRGGVTPAGKRRQEAQRAARRGPMAGRPSCASSFDGGRSFTSSHGSPYSLRRRLALVLVLSIPILLISTLDLVTFLPICYVPWILDLRFNQAYVFFLKLSPANFTYFGASNLKTQGRTIAMEKIHCKDCLHRSNGWIYNQKHIFSST